MTFLKSAVRTKHTITLKMLAALLVTVSTASCSKPQTQTVNASTAQAAQPQQAAALSGNELDALKASLKANLKASGIEAEIESIKTTEMPSLYWVRAKGVPAFFADASGAYIIQGDVIKLGDKEPVDVSAPLRKSDAKDALAAVKASDSIIFKPKGETKAVVYAFTDVDCGYCRKLHSEMDDITSRGIEVHYLAWPRAEQSIAPMENIWCSANKQDAMTKSKRGEPVAKAPRCDSPVRAQINLGMQLGVRGTPAIFTQNGEQIGGYLPARELAKRAVENQ